MWSQAIRHSPADLGLKAHVQHAVRLIQGQEAHLAAGRGGRGRRAVTGACRQRQPAGAGSAPAAQRVCCDCRHAASLTGSSPPKRDAGAVHDVNQAAGGGHQEVAAALQLAQLRGGGRLRGCVRS